MKTADAFATETAPPTAVSVVDPEVITAEGYAAAYSSRCICTTRFLISRGCSPELAEETAQAAWARGWEHHGKLREPEKVLSWVNTIAFNLFRSQFRRREVAAPIPDVPIAPQTGPGAIDIQRVLEQCNPAERALLQKYYAAGYTSPEIAQQMNCPAITVRVRLRRLRHRIQGAMTAKPIRKPQISA